MTTTMELVAVASAIPSSPVSVAEPWMNEPPWIHMNVGTLLAGPWRPVTSELGPIRRLDWPGSDSDFVDKPQCAFLNYSISYYTNGRRV